MKAPRSPIIPICLAALILSSCRVGTRADTDAASEAAAWKDRTALADGIYAILEESESVETLLPEREGSTVIENRRKFTAEHAGEKPEFLAVRSKPDVPLQLAAPPREVKSDSGKTTLRLELTQELAVRLETFTAKMQGARVAIVIGGEVVTTHTIRTPIRDGKLQISCCSAGACEYLLDQLTDNIQNQG
jgi:hypothetical protein